MRELNSNAKNSDKYLPMVGSAGENDSFQQRRRYERRKIEVPAAVISGTRHSFEKAAEVGEGGMLLLLKNELPLGTQIQVQFILPDKSFVTAIGELIYSYDVYGKRYYGVEFLDIERRFQASIRNFVADKKGLA